jgi:hypothetical protein
VAGATTTMLYDIDFAQDKLYYKTTKRWRFTSGRNLELNFEGTGDMDITADNATALAVTNSNSISTLFTINRRRKGTSIGKFSVPVISIAFKQTQLPMRLLLQIC